MQKKNDEKIVNEQFCKDFEKHSTDKHIKFCQTCANRKGDLISNILFCAMCNKKKYQDHREHKPFLNTLQLKLKLQNFKNYFHKLSFDINQISSPYAKIVHNTDDLLTLMRDQGFKKWLVSIRFWDFSDTKKSQSAQQHLIKSLKIFQKKSQIQQVDIINWKQFTQQGHQSILYKLQNELKLSNLQLDKQKLIIQQLIDVYSCYHKQEKQSTIGKIQNIISQYPNQCLPYLSKIYIIQLHQGNYQQQWKSIINQLISIKPQLKDSFLITFFQSHRYWKILTGQQAQKSNKIKFVDPLSGHVFQLTDPRAYTEFLDKAIKSKKSEDVPLIIKAARGIGYLAQQKYNEAITDYQDIMTKSSEQSFSNNLFFAKLKSNKINTQSTQVLKGILDKLEQKSKHYIINMIKLLKKQKMPKQIIKCCQILERQQNDNTFAKIQMVKAYIKLGKLKQAQQINKKYLQSKISDPLKQKINRKKLYAQSRSFAMSNNYEKSQQIWQKLASDKKSGTANFNLACMYYGQENWQTALQYLNKAIKCKNKEKYRKLRLYCYMMVRDIDKAKLQLKGLKTIQIDSQIRKFLNDS